VTKKTKVIRTKPFTAEEDWYRTYHLDIEDIPNKLDLSEELTTTVRLETMDSLLEAITLHKNKHQDSEDNRMGTLIPWNQGQSNERTGVLSSDTTETSRIRRILLEREPPRAHRSIIDRKLQEERYCYLYLFREAY
jgi:hypothetical protein